ncbi:MAG: HAD-IIB family hydrolase [Clostridiales bacterium]|nr:HAD-IIB family hydrolase [Candidatus Cacconaster stercorequi]
MGKFDGVLIASDFDNTVVYTEGALRAGTEQPPVSQTNREAIEYFMAQGGIFSIATGRALPAFAPLADKIPMNGPTVLFNGAAIYDFSADRYLRTAFLPESIRGHVHEVQAVFPDLAFEIYHDDNSIQAVNPNAITRSHQHLTHSPTVTISDIDEAPSPIAKVLLEEEPACLARVAEFIRSQPWADTYEVVLSADCLMEITAHGANKGGMVACLASDLGIGRENVYCVGDHNNDIPMLEFAHVGFAPQNAIESVHQVPGVHILPNCWEDAIAAMIAELDGLYGTDVKQMANNFS